MRSHTRNSKAKMGGRAVSSQQVAFELKQRVVLSLNKLADRDTNHLGVVELEKLVDGLGPEGITPFLSGVIETDSDQKSAVRKECVRIMGVLARFRGSLLAPHLGKMVASVVKRLKDTDSVVRDACVETVGIFASNVAGCGGDDEGGAFVVLAKPLFEALGEQNRYVQAGAALCLARVIEDTSKPPIPVLQPMLNRVTKLMKNPHFMAKPALIELVRSIIQAGGATTEHVLSAAMTSILDALKNTDWTTRKAASVALAGIAVNATSTLALFKTICCHSLEGCRFDKVKPVRDAVLHALQCWKSLPGSNSPEISEAGSSTKENFSRGYYPDASSVSDGSWVDTNSRKLGPVSTLHGNSSSLKNKRAPLSVRKTCPNYVQNHEHAKPNDWHIEISVPKAHTITLVDTQQVESEGSCVTRTFDTSNMIQGEETNYEDGDDKPECSSISDLISGSFETKYVTATHDFLNEGNSANNLSKIYRTGNGGKISENQVYALKVEGKSLESTVTQMSSPCRNACCFQTSNELALIRKELLEIESRQSSLLELLQVFMGNSMDSLSMLQSKVHCLESAIDKITQNLFHTGNHPAISSSKLVKKSVSSSPRLSSCTPRPSIDTNCRQPSRLSVRSSDNWEETASPKSRSNGSVKEAAELWKDLKLNITAKPTPRVTQNSGQGPKNSGTKHARKIQETSVSLCNSSARANTSESKNSFWKRIKDFICARDVEAAYLEALCTGDDLVLIELMDRTGPVLEKLSDETANEILCSLATHILEHRFIGSIIPWLQQVVDLSSIHEPNHLCLSTKVKREVLLSIQQAASVEYCSPMESDSLAQIAVKLRHLWCEDNARGTSKSRNHELLQCKRVSACQ